MVSALTRNGTGVRRAQREFRGVRVAEETERDDALPETLLIVVEG